MRYLNYLLLTLTSLCYYADVAAVTYYVDAKNGNNGWSGTKPDVSATNGPWQSIDKVNATSFQPGDQILFSCGQTWYKPLKPLTNGTTAAKIYFGSYPSQCNNKPKITGFQSLPSHNWQIYQGNIWKTTFPQNLIVNSGLSKSVAMWEKWPSDANQTFNATCPLSVAGCMSFLAGTTTDASLAISNEFPIVGGQRYIVKLSFYAPSDTYIGLIVRENGGSYAPLGLNQHDFTGNGQWKDVTIQFTATQTIPNARLDIQARKAKQIFVRNVQVQQNGVQSNPSSVHFDGNPITIAHHPNAGHDISTPDSVYLLTTESSPTIKKNDGSEVSSSLKFGDLKLPSGINIDPGTKLKFREIDYEINDYSVTQVVANTISIAPNTKYPLLEAGWGFYFYDALWMLDSAGEWFFDSKTQTLYLWTPTNKNPGDGVSVVTMATAIDLRTKSNLMIENLEIEGASIGIDTSNTQNVTLQNLNIFNIDDHAIYAVSSINAAIANNHITRAGKSGIEAHYSTNAFIENNEITEVGVFVKTGKNISLPMNSISAISGGSGSIIQDNLLSDIGRSGILARNDTSINSNVIQRSCVATNDCGAIYLAIDSPGTVIRNNLILEVPGDTNGTPKWHGKNVIGIYLDNGISNIPVTGNTVKGGTSSVILHNSSKVSINDNIFYGSERALLTLQEDISVLSGNNITYNQFFPTNKNISINQTTQSGDVSKFATYSNNYYSTLYSPFIAIEDDYSLGLSSSYTFQDWQDALTNGIARNNDLNSFVAAPLPSFAPGIVGNNFMNNGDFSSGLKGWGYWNAIAPNGSRNLEGCLPVSTKCLHVIGGGSDTLVHSPSFAITKGKRYRVTFDLKSTVDNGVFYPRIRSAGPTKFGELTYPYPYPILSSSVWKRYSFIFEAAISAENPTLDDQGARFDLGSLTKGQGLWIANLEITTFDPGIFGTTRSDLLVNTTDIDKTIDCPTRLSNPTLCSNYVRFPEGTAAAWPIPVPPRSGRIVFTQNLNLLDSDWDGIADSQDECTNTAKGLDVNRKGCSLAN